MSERHPADLPAFGRAPRYSALQLLVAALACTLLGVGATTFLQRRAAAPNAVDIGFAHDMIDHHDQAVLMALKLSGKEGIDPIVAKFADEVIIFQRWELGQLDSELQNWGEIRGDLDRTAMAWMGMGSAVAAMPGMQSEEALARLDAATGLEASRLFLTMMGEHHLGGVHMADYAAQHGSDPQIRELAARMARNQRVEAKEYEAQLRRLAAT